MNINKLDKSLEYLSPTLILSYFFIHNINLVLLGITISIYLINIKYINSSIKTISKNFKNKKVSTACAIKYSVNIDSNKLKLEKGNSKLTLAETIEELGFIPSKDRNDTDHST